MGYHAGIIYWELPTLWMDSDEGRPQGPTLPPLIHPRPYSLARAAPHQVVKIRKGFASPENEKANVAQRTALLLLLLMVDELFMPVTIC